MLDSNSSASQLQTAYVITALVGFIYLVFYGVHYYDKLINPLLLMPLLTVAIGVILAIKEKKISLVFTSLIFAFVLSLTVPYIVEFSQ